MEKKYKDSYEEKIQAMEKKVNFNFIFSYYYSLLFFKY